MITENIKEDLVQKYTNQVPKYVIKKTQDQKALSFNRCPVNTLYIDYRNVGEDEPTSRMIENIFKFYKGFVEIKKLDLYSFITFDTTENATFAINDYYEKYHESYQNVYLTYADAPTFSSKNKNYVYQKYKRQSSR